MEKQARTKITEYNGEKGKLHKYDKPGCFSDMIRRKSRQVRDEKLSIEPGCAGERIYSSSSSSFSTGGALMYFLKDGLRVTASTLHNSWLGTSE